MALKMLFRTKNDQTEIIGQVNDEGKSKGFWASLLSGKSGSKIVATCEGDYVSNGPKGKVETLDKDDYRDAYTS